MIKLSRTHPMHIPGTELPSSSSRRLPTYGPYEAPRFGRVLQEAVDSSRKTPPSGQRATTISESSALPLATQKDVPPFRRVRGTGVAEPNASGKTKASQSCSYGSGDFEPFIEEASRSFGLGKDLIRAVIKAESNFNPGAESRSGAVGLMQLLPSTGRDLGVRDLFDPRDNIMGGTRYLAMLLDRYRGNLKSALAAYNWGLGNLEGSPDRLPRETRRYIQRVLGYLEPTTV